VSCLLYDGSGRLLFNKAFDAVDSPAKIDLTTVDAGIYILQLTDADHSSRLKLIKH
jgi:hypothetical protein